MFIWFFACNQGYDGKRVEVDNTLQPSSEPGVEPSSSPAGEPTTEPSSPTQEPTQEPSSPSSDPDPVEDPLDTGSFTYVQKNVVPNNGFIEVSVPLTSQATSVMVAIRGKEESIVYEVVNPEGDIVFSANDWYSGNQLLTDAIYTSSTGERAFNWPIRAIDPPLYEGSWEFVFFTNDTSSTAAIVDIMIKRDTQLYAGTLNVMIGYTNDLNYVQDFETILSQAVGIWEDIYAAQGIALNITSYASSITGDIPSPYEGAMEYYNLNGQGTNQDVLIMIGENIEGLSDQFGIAGSIPGTTGRHRIGAIALSWLYAAGPDGNFDSNDIQLLGETLAHEVGHYIGLPHVVELNWSRYDALEDTPVCTSLEDCESTFDSYLMYPYPICTVDSCIPQTVVTSEQKNVWHRYVGVD